MRRSADELVVARKQLPRIPGPWMQGAPLSIPSEQLAQPIDEELQAVEPAFPELGGQKFQVQGSKSSNSWPEKQSRLVRSPGFCELQSNILHAQSIKATRAIAKCNNYEHGVRRQCCLDVKHMHREDRTSVSKIWCLGAKQQLLREQRRLPKGNVLHPRARNNSTPRN